MKRYAIVLACLLALPGVWAPAALAAGESPEQLYQLYCVQCHGLKRNGTGVNWSSGALAVYPMDHTSAKNMGKLDDAGLKAVIAKGGDAVGKSELMPPWGEVLNEAQIDGLVAYLRQLCKCRYKK